MNVKQLITELKKVDPTKEIHMLSDAEGNNTHGLSFVDNDEADVVYLVPDDQYIDDEDAIT